MSLHETPFDLIGASLAEKIPLPAGLVPEKGICAFTGRECDTLPRAKVLDKSFNKHDFLLAPGSDRVGVNAWRTLQWKDERMACWVFYDGKLHTVGDISKGKDFSRAQAREMTLGFRTLPSPWCGYWSISFHKHGAFCSPVNFSETQNFWGFEDHAVDCSNRAFVQVLFNHLMELKVAGAMEFELESLQFTAKTVNAIGLPTILRYRERLDEYRKSTLYGLLMYLLYSVKEIKEMGKDAQERWPLR